MAYPEQWLKAAIETAGGCLAYPMEAPEGAALPYVIYGRTSTQREAHLGGDTPSPQGQFSVLLYSQTYSGVKSMADLVRAALHNFNGTASGVTIRQCLILEELDGSPDYLEGQDKPTYTVEHTYQIRWEE
jgi:hypothetical protein